LDVFFVMTQARKNRHEKGKMDTACGKHGTNEKFTKTLVAKLDGKRPLERQKHR